MKSFKALSALLSYPSAELCAAIPQIRDVLHQEGLIGPRRLAELDTLLHQLADRDLYELQERYVLLFDRSRTLSLNLFEHIHGESRDRGGAMVDLLETYRAGGFDLAGPELPDHLPVLLEYLSTRPLPEARAILADAAHIIAALAERLHRREAAYAAVMTTLVALSEADAEPPAELAGIPDDDPEDLAALDAVWEEAQVTFGPDPNAGCPVSRDLLARMDAR
ncbi:nitrate reductase molybdenum cofactor assembly chaperone [Paracoccus fistulariae]|uniref:Nitrate reductase molybdenum cofactor assembly chaperone n=1 Tax=Paracoccus fistulariae TaxID=658446 RepID=A0ABY7SK22_9RHOB|nr:nitrate reductase molybdenum cofactor assembly chaperone [Paracoccus fistulariae]MDB6181314.1 nitrate reductase molybdenum cofactor assembly chaperone [Paracoccus fistulariae]WCR07363.1 nitrate reductase molybdenum cofactor assembly chaperone [Paracoccus fistulariae]